MTGAISHRDVNLNIAECVLHGDLAIPQDPCGVVLFAHGSGSGRLSPRNRHVAQRLNESRLCTLLLDLLTEDEEREDRQTGHLRFDIGLLTDRLSGATDWLKNEADLSGLPVGYFGASTGAAAAMAASVRHPSAVQAVVSRGGRPELAEAILGRVTAPTLLIVGSLDDMVLQLNQEAKEGMAAEVQLELVQGASHLFEEPGKLDDVANLAAAWFTRNLCKGTS